jgi:hypothetical protein
MAFFLLIPIGKNPVFPKEKSKVDHFVCLFVSCISACWLKDGLPMTSD